MYPTYTNLRNVLSKFSPRTRIKKLYMVTFTTFIITCTNFNFLKIPFARHPNDLTLAPRKGSSRLVHFLKSCSVIKGVRILLRLTVYYSLCCAIKYTSGRYVLQYLIRTLLKHSFQEQVEEFNDLVKFINRRLYLRSYRNTKSLYRNTVQLHYDV